jgi:hypothetical protein
MFVEPGGRPGIGPGTLGSKKGHPSASLVVHLSWSGAVDIPPTPEEVLSNLGLRSENCQHELG